MQKKKSRLEISLFIHYYEVKGVKKCVKAKVKHYFKLLKYYKKQCKSTISLEIVKEQTFLKKNWGLKSN